MENLTPTPTNAQHAAMVIATGEKIAPAAFAYLKERITALLMRGAVALYSGDPKTAKPTIGELLELATAALDIARDHVIADAESSEHDLRRVENTRHALIESLHGCPTAALSKRDAFYTLGALLDAGFATSLADLLNGPMMGAVAHVCNAPEKPTR